MERITKSKSLLATEIVIAISLSVSLFLFIRSVPIPGPGGTTEQAFLFTYLAKSSDVHESQRTKDLVQIPFKHRLLAPIITGFIVDKTAALSNGNMSSATSKSIFGAWNTLWFMLLMAALMYFRKDALFVMLGVFSGMMYNWTDPNNGPMYLPFDTPTLFFFTLERV